MQDVVRVLRAYAISIGSLSLLLALPGTSFGIFSGSVVHFVLGYAAFLLFIFLAFTIALMPLLPLLAFAASSDGFAKTAAVVLVPAFLLALSEVGSLLAAALGPVSGSVWLRVEALLPYAVVPAMIVVINFFVIEAAMRKRSEQER